MKQGIINYIKMMLGIVLMFLAPSQLMAVPTITQSNNTPSCTMPSSGGDIRWTNSLVGYLNDSGSSTPSTWTENGVEIKMDYVDATNQDGSNNIIDYS